MAEPITPNSVGRVNTVRCEFYGRLVGVDLRDTRIKRLQLFAQRHAAEGNPSRLGELIGKKPNQVYNLLHGTASFGEKVARSIEEAAGLPRYWLDAEGVEVTGLPPEIAELAEAISALPENLRGDVLTGIRNLLHLAQGAVAQANGSAGLSGVPTQENMNAVQRSAKRMKTG